MSEQEFQQLEDLLCRATKMKVDLSRMTPQQRAKESVESENHFASLLHANQIPAFSVCNKIVSNLLSIPMSYPKISISRILQLTIK